MFDLFVAGFQVITCTYQFSKKGYPQP